MDIIFETIDKTGRKIHLSKERYKHILRHPHMHNVIDRVKETLQNPLTIRYFEEDPKARYFYQKNSEEFYPTLKGGVCEFFGCSRNYHILKDVVFCQVP